MNQLNLSEFRASNMLRDVVFEINELMERSRTESREFQSGLFSIASILWHQLENFEIDQSEYPRPLIDPDEWFLGGKAKK